MDCNGWICTPFNMPLSVEVWDKHWIDGTWLVRDSCRVIVNDVSGMHTFGH